MKIRFQLLACLASWSLALSPSLAQTAIPNGNFETWDDVGQNTEEPTNWNSNETGSGFATLGPQTCFREDNSPYNGTYCLRLTTGNFFGTPINASATTGRIEAPSTNVTSGFIRTLTNDVDFNSPFTGRPDSLVGWFKYTPGSGDGARIQALIHGNYDVEVPDQGGSAPFVIAEAEFNTSATVNGWTRFSVPFVYNNTNTPTHILLIATASSTAGGAVLGSELFLDGLEAIYNCTDVQTTITPTVCDSYTAPSGQVYTMTGQYMDTIPNGSCDSIFTIDLTVNTADTSVTNNGMSLMANATNATFQWVDCNNGNTPITGETNAMFSPATSGNYAVEVTQNGCTSLSACYSVVLSAVSTPELAYARVYPNPNTGNFQLNLGTYAGEAQMTIVDINGRIVLAQQLQDKQTTVTLDQPAGVYFVRIVTSTEEKVIKLLKQ